MFNYNLHPAEQICFILRRICDIGIGTISGGGASVCDETGAVWMSPKGKAKTELKPEMIAKYLSDGTQDGPNRGSTEAPVFLAMHKARPDLKAIIHSHAPTTLAYMLSHKQPNIRAIAGAAAELPHVAYVPFELAGSQALTDRAAKAFGDGADFLLLEGHGSFIGGKDIYEAFAKLEIMENAALSLMNAGATGHEVKCLSDGQIAEYRREKEAIALPVSPERTVSMKELLLRKELAVIAMRAYKEKHILSRMGSVSLRISDNAFFITPRFADFYDLRPEELVLVENGAGEPGKEVPSDIDIHLAVYNAHKDVHSILVAVSPNILTFAVTDLPFKANADFEVYMIVHDTAKVPFGTDANGIAKSITFETPGVFVGNTCFVSAGFSKFDPIRCLGIVQCGNVLGSLESNVAGSGMALQYLDKDVLENIYKGFWG